jgi:hypothetical protein
MSFKVPLPDSNKESLERRVQEKLDAGYTLLTPIRSESILRNDYNWREKHGKQYSFAGNELHTKYKAVVMKV